MREKFRPQNIEIWSTLAWLILYILQMVNASKGLGGNTMADINAAYEHLLLPHPAARYVWWFLALAMAFFVWAQFFEDHRIHELKLSFIRPMGLSTAVLGIVWLVLYQAELSLISLLFGFLVLFFLFLMLAQLSRRSLIGRDALMFQLPISLLMGWSIFVWIQNLMTLLAQKVTGFGESQLWAILLLIISTFIFIALITQLKDLAMAGSYILGYIFILANQFGPLKSRYIGLWIITLLLTGALIIFAVKLYQNSKKRQRRRQPPAPFIPQE